MFVAGVDLAVKRPSALAVLDNCELLLLAFAKSDEEIEKVISLMSPLVVAIDAPLTKPSSGGLRDVEKELRKLGHRLLPPLMGPMRELTKRGIELSKKLNTRVVEVHPLTSLRSMGVTRSEVGKKYGVYNVDLIDAIVAALTALAYLLGQYRSIGPFVYPTTRVCL
ncbi:MAG: DUF429 domain-containing protein [Pyrobaculum sp.]